MKLERHSKIVELIGKYEIDTQEELAARLNEAGFNVTQATVSRDIRELKLSKIQGEGGRQNATRCCIPRRAHERQAHPHHDGTASCPWTWPRTFW